MPNPNTETVRVGTFDVPAPLARLTGCSPENFEEYGNAQFNTIQRFLHIGPRESVLEIGCGVGRLAIPATRVIVPPGSYLGIDIIRPSIQWCSENITTRFPHFRFHFENVNSQIHNPSGIEDPASTRIPLPNSSVDKLFLSSVFTHMFPAGMENYLHEFRRVLKPGGTVLSTMFLLHERSMEAIRNGKTNWKFAHEYNHSKICWFDAPAAPEGAVAYRESAYVAMIRRCGMDLRMPIEYGTWAGLGGPLADGQDYVVFGPANV